MADNPSITLKRPGNVSINRALNCTKEIANKHLDDMAEELILCGIMTNAKKISDGVWNGSVDLTRLTPFLIEMFCLKICTVFSAVL